MSSHLIIILSGILLALVTFLYGRMRGRSRGPRRPQGLIPHDDPAPPTGTKFLDVHATRKVASGKPIHVKVTEGGRPVKDVELRLIITHTGTVYATAKTDPNGQARIPAPTVTEVTAFELEAHAKGYSVYIPRDDPRAWTFYQGVYPAITVTVWPGRPAVTPPSNSPKVWIDVGFGWTAVGRHATMDALEAQATKDKREFDEDWWVVDGTICDHLKALGPEDMWGFSGHAYQGKAPNTATSLAGWRPFATIGGYTKVTTADMCKCIRPSGGPGVAFLDACSSASLAPALVKCCVRVAVGWDRPVPGLQSSGAMREFFLKLLKGGTLDQAVAVANNHLSRGFHNSNARLKVSVKPWLKNAGSMTFKQISETAPPTYNEEEGD